MRVMTLCDRVAALVKQNQFGGVVVWALPLHDFSDDADADDV